uniref:Cyclic nucleotide-binding domain-containing protein n=1 Tax=Fagus sylvatica TaxID=28930 RepID=A0A2N9H0X0_FAGSY
MGDKDKSISKEMGDKENSGSKEIGDKSKFGSKENGDKSRGSPLPTTAISNTQRSEPIGTSKSPVLVDDPASPSENAVQVHKRKTTSVDQVRRGLARMVILHEYPLSMVDHIGFREFVGLLQPMFKMICRNTLKRDIFKIYDNEKEKALQVVDKNESRIAITTDMWTSSNKKRGFMVVTAHFVNKSWTLESRVLRFIYVPSPHTKEILCNVLLECLFEWNIDRKLSTVTVDNCTTNDAMLRMLLDKLPISSLMLGGSLLHMRCAAHILNLVVQDGLTLIGDGIEKIRDSVLFWTASPKRRQKFDETARQLRVPCTKELVLDCKTRWNSTYLMLSTALVYKDVFSRLKQRDSSYTSLPNERDWHIAKEICERLELFYNVTEIFSGTTYPTANMYFPLVCDLKIALSEWSVCSNELISKMASSMILKFDNYWSDINGIMGIAAILDPRYKMKLLEFYYPSIYGLNASAEIVNVKRLCCDLLDEYGDGNEDKEESSPMPTTSSFVGPSKSSSLGQNLSTSTYVGEIVFAIIVATLGLVLFGLLIGSDQLCVANDMILQVVLTIVRSVTDVFYVIQIFVRFHTAYVAPSSRVFGRGELVIDSSKIAMRYLKRGFFIDLIAALPLPQVLTWVVIPNVRGTVVTVRKNAMWFIMLVQYLPRVVLMYPLLSQLVNATGIISEPAWAGAAYNLMLYLLASHLSGAWWYLLAIERQEACWRSACDLEQPNCQNGYFDCHNINDDSRTNWVNSTNVTNLCVPTPTGIPVFYHYGIYGDAVNTNVIASRFFSKYFYCLWWGLRNLSSTGQNLSTSTYMGEDVFTIFVATLGLFLFALLIGNMQRYLQSATLRLEEWRIRRTDTEQWMHHRQLPPELKQSIRQYDQYKWLATRGVDEETLLDGLPMELRREIKRHLCLSLVRRVPLFNQMDEIMLDAVCERLKPALCTKDMFLVREGDPVNHMLFIIRGHLESYTTDGGRSGFFNSIRLGSGDFCGEELLTWALDPQPNVILPSSTRAVKAITEVEAFALVVEDLKFVTSQFRRLHSKQLRHTFRFYSHQWRSWAACFIQAAWRRYKKQKEMDEHEFSASGRPLKASFWTKYAELLIEETRSRRFVLNSAGSVPSDNVNLPQKPIEVDFD